MILIREFFDNYVLMRVYGNGPLRAIAKAWRMTLGSYVRFEPRYGAREPQPPYEIGEE